jgi:hypothetical protein
MAVGGYQFCMMAADRPIDDLYGVIRTPPDRNTIASEHMGDFTLVVRKFDAENGHELMVSEKGSKSRTFEKAEVVPYMESFTPQGVGWEQVSVQSTPEFGHKSA